MKYKHLLLAMIFLTISGTHILGQSWLEQYLKAVKIRKNISLQEGRAMLLVLLENKDSLTAHREVAIYNELGNIDRELGKYNKAIMFYEKATNICISNFGADYYQLSRIYNNLGIAYKIEGLYEKAIDYYNRAIYLVLNSDLSETEGEIIELAKLYHNTGIAYRYQDKNILAISYLKKSEKIKKKYNLSSIEIVYANIARTYSKMGIYPEAKAYFLKSILEQNRTDLNRKYKIGSLYLDYGTLLIKIGKEDSALIYLTKGLEIYRNSRGEKHPFVANAYRKVGNYYEKLGNHKKASKYIQKALISNSLNFDSHNIFDNPKIDDCLWKSELFSCYKVKILNLLKYSSKLNQLDKTQHLEGAINTSKLAYELADLMKREYTHENTKLLLSEKAKSFHQTAIKVAYELNKYQPCTQNKETIFNFLEKSKSTTLAAHLYDIRVKNYADISDSLLEKEEDILTYRRYYQTQIQKEKTKGEKMDSVKVNNYQDMLFTYSKSYDTLINTLEEKYPEYYQLKYKQKVADINSIQHQLGENKALISYFVGDTSLFIVALTNGSVVYKEIKTDSLFETAIIDYHIDVKSGFNQQIKESSAYLYDYLIKPIEELISTKSDLVIIPDGCLYYIPFETLCKSETYSGDLSSVDYLIKKYKISYHHSATLWLNNHNREQKEVAEKSFVGFAPVFDSKVNNGYILSSDWISDTTNIDLTTRSISSDLKYFNALPHSEKEIKSILKLFKKKRANVEGFFHHKANEENFKNNIRDYKYVHIASHSFTNDKYPALSGIAFSQPDTTSGNNEDGIFYASESYNLNLSNSELVVLSSCSSGLGKLIKGEGFLSLSRGFLYSGAPNIVFSLWNVKDEQTKDLMVHFYKQILNNKSYAEALREAKLKLLSNNETASPKYWAAWLLVGE